MIIEGIVTTLDEEDRLNIAPMGPSLEPDFQRFLLRPFTSSTTYRNLKRQREGVLHISDDVLLLARATIGAVTDAPTQPAMCIHGRILLNCCRYYEFRVVNADESGERVSLLCQTLKSDRFRDMLGFNRARHAVLETAILASRIHFLPADGLGEELARHQLIVEKTGDSPEFEAFALLRDHIKAVTDRRGLVLGTAIR